MAESERYRIEHPLFEGIEFSNPEAAENAAERLCTFLVKNTDRDQALVSITHFFEENGCAQWWHHVSVTASLSISAS